MTSRNRYLQHLHDKATRGVALSAEEQSQLEVWYTEQDQDENALLESTRSSENLTPLHTEVGTVIEQLVTASQRIQELTAQNEALRQEIDALQHQLTHPSTPKHA